MSDPFQRVNRSDRMRLPAQLVNQFVETSLADLAQPLYGEEPQPTPDGAALLLRNQSGQDLDQYGVAGLGAPTVTPAAGDADWRNLTAFDTASPAAGGKFAILQEALPSPSDCIAGARLAGISKVKVNLTSSSHKYADAASGNYTNLVSQAAFGPAYILWYETQGAFSAGVQWAYVLFDGSGYTTNSCTDCGGGGGSPTPCGCSGTTPTTTSITTTTDVVHPTLGTILPAGTYSVPSQGANGNPCLWQGVVYNAGFPAGSVWLTIGATGVGSSVQWGASVGLSSTGYGNPLYGWSGTFTGQDCCASKTVNSSFTLGGTTGPATATLACSSGTGGGGGGGFSCSGATACDTFTDTTGTALTAHTPDTAPSGNWLGGSSATIQGNRLAFAMTNDPAKINTTLTAGQRGQVDYYTPASGTFIPIAFFGATSGLSGGWSVEANSVNGTLALYPGTSGDSGNTVSAAASAPQTLVAGTRYTLGWSIDSSGVINVYLNGSPVLVYSAGTGAVSGGYGGLLNGLGAPAGGFFDNWSVATFTGGGGGGGGFGCGGAYLCDDYTDATGTPVASGATNDHSMNVGSGYTTWSGSGATGTPAWQITGGQLAVSFPGAATGIHGLVADAGHADGTAQLDVLFSVGGGSPTGSLSSAGFAFRWASATDFWWTNINIVTDKFQLWHRVSGADTLAGDADFFGLDELMHTHQAILNGSSVSVTIDGGSTITASDSGSTQTAAKYGPIVHDNATANFDNFRVGP